MEETRRPAFARAFPREPALDALVAAFERGDYAHVRAEAPRLADTTPDTAVKDAARTLVERTRPDRLAVALMVLTGVLLAALTAYWSVNGKPPPGQPAPTTRPPVIEHPR